jgi:hypothetical protein
MKKKIPLLILSMLTIFLLITSSTAQPIVSLQDKQSNSKDQIFSTDNKLSSCTIHDLIEAMDRYIDQLPIGIQLKQRLHKYIDNGIIELKNNGITVDQTVRETQNYEPTGLKGPFQKNHLFLMNILPDIVSINVILPTYRTNISNGNSSDNESENNTQVLELFVKLVPFVDSVQTQNRILLRKLYQKTSSIWPAVGGRILDNETTIFILAFGPQIDWSMRFF